MKKQLYTIDWWMKWSSSVVLIVGAWLTSFDVVPLNKILGFIGNFGWLIVGIMWREWSLVVISAVLTVIYIAGYI
jgi:hypothetical protein